MEEVGRVAGPKQPPVVGRLDDATNVVSAASRLLQQVAAFLRQLVSVVGWLTLLAGAIGLLIHPHLSLGHLLVPSAGAIAVLQSTIKPRRKHPDENSSVPIGEILGHSNHQLFSSEKVGVEEDTPSSH